MKKKEENKLMEEMFTDVITILAYNGIGALAAAVVALIIWAL